MIINRKFFFIVTIAFRLSAFGNLMAQQDTVQLQTVTVQGFVPQSFMSGLKIQRIDSVTLQSQQFRNISDILASYTPIAFKNYGPGQLNTVSFRGTSANHTAVLWNGLNINSPVLGQTDFSTIPVAGFDRLSVQYGSAASVVGTDAAGGSILLSSDAPGAGFAVSAGRQQESFRNHQSQLTARYGYAAKNGWNVSGKTALYYGRMNNDFPYAQRRGYPILPAENTQKGIIQDFFIKSGRDRELSAHVWLTENRLTLVPDNREGRELTLTQAYRTMLRYRIRDVVLRSSWVRDVIDYARGGFANPDHAVSDKFANRIEKDFGWNIGSAYLDVKAGGELAHYRARVEGYETPLVTENRGDLFILTRLAATSRLVVSANLRQAFVAGYNPPFTPSLGTHYVLLSRARYQLKVKGSVGKSYRVPTLNERYWAELGNPDIRPEDGWNKEAGLEQDFSINKNHTLHASLTAYHNRIRDWTYWNPAKNYRVENLQQVLSRGLELHVKLRAVQGVSNYGAEAVYAYTKSMQETAYDAYSSDVIGKQLVFVPKHTGNFNVFFQYKNSRVTGQLQSVSKRYTTFDNSQFIPGYLLTNLLAETSVKISKVTLRVQGQVYNLANTFYLNVRNNAMPGRSFAVSLVADYNSLSER